MNKQCYIRFNEDLHLLYNDRFIRMALFTFEDDGGRCCHLSGQANWEISRTGPEADALFDELLTMEQVSWADLKRMGFTQYG
jgi:hypothetical protein